MKGLRQAIAFLTVLPTSPPDASPELAVARAYFPLVGLILGGVLVGVDLLLRPVLSPLLCGAVLVVTMVVLTRALHIEGFMDACDGLLGGYTRERRLEIMRDSRVGAFAVIGVVCLLMVKWTAIVGLPSPVRLPVLALFPCLSRWAMLMALDAFPYARSQGMGTSFLKGRKRVQVVFGFVTAIVASVLLAGGAGVLLLALTIVVAWGVGRWMSGLLGGLTGDTYGAINEVCEVAILLAVIILEAAMPATFGWPLLWGRW